MASNGNFGTWNPLADYSSGTTFSNGNCTTALNQQNQYRACLGPAIPDSGKWYIEFFIDYQTAGFPTLIGLLDGTINSGLDGSSILDGQGSFHIEPMTGKLYSESTTGTSYTGNSGSPAAVGNADAKVGIAIDRDNNKLWFAVNNTWINVGSGVGDPANDSNPAVSSIEENLSISHSIRQATGTSKVVINCGQDSTFGGLETAGGNADDNGFGDFFYAPPSGFLALSSANLPISDDIDPAQTDSNFPQKQCGVVTYTGTGSSNAITGLGFRPDLVIIKNRPGTQGTKITDSSRGVTKVLQAPTSSAESTDSNGLTAFGSDGFTVGSDAGYNGSSNGMVAWCWRANGGTTASNSDGDITSTVQANTAAGFSIVQYTGVSSATTATVGHGLGKAPTFIIHKGLNVSSYHFVRGVPGMTSATTVRDFNPNGSPTDVSGSGGALVAPTSTTFNINNYTGIGGGGYNYVAYCWAAIEGYSKFGTYTGNSNADGPFIYTGFRPRIVLTFGENFGRENFIWDTERSTFNPVDDYLRWGRSSAEGTSSSVSIDILSNGFKARGTNADYNSDNVIYAAWGDVPFKYNNTF